VELPRETDRLQRFVAAFEKLYGSQPRIELFVNDPVTMHKKALAAGATEHSPVEEHQHTTIGRLDHNQFGGCCKVPSWTRSAICGSLGKSLNRIFGALNRN
jgi:hypothetical protein